MNVDEEAGQEALKNQSQFDQNKKFGDCWGVYRFREKATMA